MNDLMVLQKQSGFLTVPWNTNMIADDAPEKYPPRFCGDEDKYYSELYPAHSSKETYIICRSII